MQPAARPKANLGRYQLVRHLASGGMADVILARIAGIEGFKRHVVIKRIHDEQVQEPRFVQMFLDEARLAASLHHHNIVQVHELGEEDGEYFFAMEYVHGEDLRKVLAHLAETDQRVPVDHCVTIGLATAAALHHAHELRGPDRKLLGIVHCDVSPANIVVGFDGDVKVIDFGIAITAAQPAPATQTTQTGTDLLRGKVAYMSPEQCLGGAIDRRSDVFCLGIVLYELVTVRRLFKGANDFLTMTSITQGEIPPPSTIRPDLPPALEAIILKALAYEPADRYQTADELRVALERFAVAAKLQTSATALGDFMRGVFGDRVMPWLVEDDEPEISIDFDGDRSGVVAAPAELPAAIEAAPGSLLARARAKIGTADTITGPSRPVAPAAPAPAPVRPPPVPATARPPVDARTELLLDDDLLDDEVAPPRRSRRWLVAGLAVVPLAIVVALALRSPTRSGSPAPAPAPTASPTPPLIDPPAPPVPAPATPPIDGAVPTAPLDLPAKAPPPPPVAPTAGERKPGKRPAPPRPTHGTWDPKALFPPTRWPLLALAMRRSTLALVLATLAAPALARADAKAEGKAHVERATALHAQGQLAAALTELTVAYSLDPQPPLLYAIAQIHVQLGDCPQAITFYQRFLDAAERRAAAAAREAIDVCEHAPPPPITPTGPPPPDEQPVDAPPPTTTTAPTGLARGARGPRRDVVGLALIGGGVALGVAAGVTYGLARADVDDADAATTYAAWADANDRAHGKRLGAGVLAGLGVAVAGAGVYHLWRHRTHAPAVAIAPTAGGGVVSWTRSF